MIDDLLEAVLEIGGEVAEIMIGHGMKKRRKNGEKQKPDPWERAQEKPPWEE